jgi:hypothetical protein
MTKEARTPYEPPRARDLSAISASGQEPMGECMAGAQPYYNCVIGTNFVGACGPGGTPDTSDCVAGTFHTIPTCDAGTDAATICLSGSGQQW